VKPSPRSRLTRLATTTGAALMLSAAFLPTSAVAQPTAPGGGGAAAAITSSEYRLGAGDVIRISVFQNPDLTLEARISDSGAISYPLIGQVRLEGLTTGQAETRIADALRTGNFVKQPQVSILVTQVRGNLASVLGQVGRPGRYPIEAAELRLSDLLATAGGVLTTGADTAVVVGTRNGRPFRAEVDLVEAFGPNRPTADVVIRNGDVVYVDRSPQVYIYGEVQRPGVIRLERGMTVLQALAAGGGLTQRGTQRGIRVHRRGADGKTEVLQPGMDDRLLPGDVVYIRESIF
jgi:polysaccharide export outer membrane protein